MSGLPSDLDDRVRALESGGPGGGWVRGTSTITTASLADGATDTGTLTLAPGWRLMSVGCDRGCRVRLYVSGAARTADAGRAIGTDVDIATDHGLWFEYVTGALSATLSPTVDGFCPSGSDVFFSVTNRSGGTSTVEVVFDYVRTE